MLVRLILRLTGILLFCTPLLHAQEPAAMKKPDAKKAPEVDPAEIILKLPSEGMTRLYPYVTGEDKRKAYLNSSYIYGDFDVQSLEKEIVPFERPDGTPGGNANVVKLSYRQLSPEPLLNLLIEEGYGPDTHFQDALRHKRSVSPVPSSVCERYRNPVREFGQKDIRSDGAVVAPPETVFRWCYTFATKTYVDVVIREGFKNLSAKLVESDIAEINQLKTKNQELETKFEALTNRLKVLEAAEAARQKPAGAAAREGNNTKKQGAKSSP
jgi:hypothetical protein